jgi:hypothetical protein
MWATITFDVGRDYAMWATITVKQKMRPTSQPNRGPHHTGISGPHPMESPAHFDRNTHQGLDYVEYHHWIKLLPFVYRVSTHLDDYVQNFCGLDYGNGTALNVYTILNPALDPELEGGLIAPSLSQTVGLGIFFILRELVRTNTIRGDRILSHCFVPSFPIRRAFGNLGCDIDLGAGRVARLEWSQQIMDFIRSHGVGDVTFSRAFDIPFIVLSNPLWLDSSDHEGRELSNFWIEWSNGQ